MGLLVLARNINERIVLDFAKCSDADLRDLRTRPIEVVVVGTKADSAKLGIDAPDRVGVDRLEIYRAKQADIAAALAAKG